MNQLLSKSICQTNIQKNNSKVMRGTKQSESSKKVTIKTAYALHTSTAYYVKTQNVFAPLNQSQLFMLLYITELLLRTMLGAVIIT